eukprot:27015-Prymnesium_polylepis.2
MCTEPGPNALLAPPERPARSQRAIMREERRSRTHLRSHVHTNDCLGERKGGKGSGAVTKRLLPLRRHPRPEAVPHRGSSRGRSEPVAKRADNMLGRQGLIQRVQQRPKVAGEGLGAG